MNPPVPSLGFGKTLAAGIGLALLAAAAMVTAKALPGQTTEEAPAVPQTPQKATPQAQRPALEPPAARQRIAERLEMVRKTITHPDDLRTPVRDEAVVEAIKTAPRHVFVPRERRSLAYRDSPLSIGYGQTISQPYIVALMSELLDLDPSDKVLEIGTGSGYQAAVLGSLTPNVYTVEIIKPLYERAQRDLLSQGYDDVHCLNADGYYGWAEHAPFDAIIVTCAAGHLPPPLWEQLAVGGRIVIPIGGPYQVQRLVVLRKLPDGSRRSEAIIGVRFVPMTGAVERTPENGR